MIGGRVSFVYVNKKASGKRVSDDLIPRSMLGKFVITTCVFDWGAQSHKQIQHVFRTWENAQGFFFLVFLPFAGHQVIISYVIYD